MGSDRPGLNIARLRIHLLPNGERNLARVLVGLTTFWLLWTAIGGWIPLARWLVYGPPGTATNTITRLVIQVSVAVIGFAIVRSTGRIGAGLAGLFVAGTVTMQASRSFGPQWTYSGASPAATEALWPEVLATAIVVHSLVAAGVVLLAPDSRAGAWLVGSGPLLTLIPLLATGRLTRPLADLQHLTPDDSTVLLRVVLAMLTSVAVGWAALETGGATSQLLHPVTKPSNPTFTMFAIGAKLVLLLALLISPWTLGFSGLVNASADASRLSWVVMFTLGFSIIFGPTSSLRGWRIVGMAVVAALCLPSILGAIESLNTFTAFDRLPLGWISLVAVAGLVTLGVLRSLGPITVPKVIGVITYSVFVAAIPTLVESIPATSQPSPMNSGRSLAGAVSTQLWPWIGVALAFSVVALWQSPKDPFEKTGQTYPRTLVRGLAPLTVIALVLILVEVAVWMAGWFGDHRPLYPFDVRVLRNAVLGPVPVLAVDLGATVGVLYQLWSRRINWNQALAMLLVVSVLVYRHNNLMDRIELTALAVTLVVVPIVWRLTADSGDLNQVSRTRPESTLGELGLLLFIAMILGTQPALGYHRIPHHEWSGALDLDLLLLILAVAHAQNLGGRADLATRVQPNSRQNFRARIISRRTGRSMRTQADPTSHSYGEQT